MPSKQHNNISVYRVTDLYEVDIWDIGHEFVSVPSGKPLLGRADIPARGVRGQGLEIEPAPNPHIRHANIINWPGTTEDRLIAIKLAEESQLVLVPGNGSLITISD